MHRVLFVSLLTAGIFGCGGGSTTNPLPNSLLGSFAIIESAVTDLSNSMNAPTYRASADLGTDEDHIGFAMINLKTNAAGSRIAPDVEEIEKKYQALQKAAQSRAPLAKQREAVKELKDAVAATKAKL